ncbi:MAG: UDP-N-acetylmuramoyl-L-alanine--D-glutamate ligase [Lachnospiraceae bacterium]
MNWMDKHFLVFGTGKSGIASADLLQRHHISTVVYDSNHELDVEAVKQREPALKNIEFLTGDFPKERIHEFDIVVVSPGIPTDLPILQLFRDFGIVVWGEIELAYRFSKGKILAVTGTNGKTTTTALLGAILKTHFPDVMIVGNIGIPYTSMCDKTTPDTVTAVEISSFQLETVIDFKPNVSALLNITPDHLDRHHTMEGYIQAKERVTMNQSKQDLCVLNYEDEILRDMAMRVKPKIWYFSSERKLEEGMYLDGKIIKIKRQGIEDELCHVDDLQILGKHNVENAMAAASMALGIGVPVAVIRDVLKRFESVEHRIEFVKEVNEVRYYNDSKGTNPDAAIKGIQAMTRPTILIGGGYDKNSEYTEWILAFAGKVKKLILIGQTRYKIAEVAQKEGFTSIIMADSLEEAVEMSFQEADKGDAVLLSPACASWGMFTNYEERGNRFKELVHRLKE